MSDHDPENLDDPWLDELYQANQAEQPPPALDQAILDQAAKKGRAPVWYKWSTSLATAAVVILTVGVFLNQALIAPEPSITPSQNVTEAFRLSSESLQDQSKAVDPTTTSAPERESMAEKKFRRVAPAAISPAKPDAMPPQPVSGLASTSTAAPLSGPGVSLSAEPTAAAEATMNAEMQDQMIEEIVVSATYQTDALGEEASARNERQIEGIVSRSRMSKSASLDQMVLAEQADTAIEVTYAQVAECADEDCVRVITHPDCEEPFPLQDEAAAISIETGHVRYNENDEALTLRCIYGDWTVEIVLPTP